MNGLNNHQMVLLVMLVSFVTSIATGIITVTLLQEAPPVVTQTINRVVERTVERVVPGDDKNTEVVTQKVTVVVKEDDLITDAVVSNLKSIVRVLDMRFEEQPKEKEPDVLTIGFVLDQNGYTVVDRNKLPEGVREFVVETRDGSQVFAHLEEPLDTESPLGFLQPVSVPDGAEFIPVEFAPAKNIQLGRRAIALGGANGDTVFTGIVSEFYSVELDPEEGTSVPYMRTDIALDRDSSGGPLFDLDGKVMGMNFVYFNDVEYEAVAVPSYVIEDAYGQIRARSTEVPEEVHEEDETLNEEASIPEKVPSNEDISVALEGEETTS